MLSKLDYKNTDKQQVFLPPVQMEFYKTLNYEPQYVTTRDVNRAFIYIESEDSKLEMDKTKFIASTIRNQGDNAGTLFTKISRVSLVSFRMYNTIPGINARNNTVTFFSDNSGLFHTVVIPEGFYNNAVTGDSDPDLMVDALITALNTVTGASGLTFSKTSDPLWPRYYNIDSVGGNYYFDPNSDFVRRGGPIFNAQIDTALTNSKQIGPINYYYTYFVDICSNLLTKYTKVQNASNGLNSNILVRLNQDISIDKFSNAPYTFEYSPAPHQVVSFNFNPEDSISFIDFELKDQFGDYLYVNPSKPGFNWSITIKIEA